MYREREKNKCFRAWRSYTQRKKLLRIRFVDSHICDSFCQTGLTGFKGFLFVSQLPEEAEKM
jgi:hypothetical protein